MFDYTDYTLTYILIIGIVLFLIIMGVIYKRTSRQKVKTGIVLLSIIVFICGGYEAMICKSKTDQRLQEIAESRQLFETYSGPACIQYKNYPPIYIDSDADIKNITVNSLKEYLDKTPEWLYKNANSITLSSNQNLINTFPSFTEDTIGLATSQNKAIYLTPYVSFIPLEHEFGHIYDYTFFITRDQSAQDITPYILKTNQKAVCEAVSTLPDDANDFNHCMSNYQETFADAMALYVESPDKLPPDLKAWIDSLPK